MYERRFAEIGEDIIRWLRRIYFLILLSLAVLTYSVFGGG